MKKMNIIRVAVLLYVVFANVFPQETVLYTFKVSDAHADTTIRKDAPIVFTHSKDSSFKSIDVDLNNDGKVEKLIPNEYFFGTGGCTWSIYDPANNRTLGEIDALNVSVLKSKTKGYYNLKCSWLSDGEYIFSFYIFNGTKYIEVK